MKATNLFTRKQYLDNEVSHDQYYGQFVTDATINTVLRYFSKEQLTEVYKEGPNLNSIKLSIWDNMPLNAATYKMKEAGDWLTQAGKVCILKCVSRIIIESNNL